MHRFKCTSTKPILPSVDATTFPPRSPPEVPPTRNSPKKLQSTSHHAMNLVWFLTPALQITEYHITKPSPAERLAHEWAILFPVSIRALFVEKVSLHWEQQTKNRLLEKFIKSTKYNIYRALYLTQYLYLYNNNFFRIFLLHFSNFQNIIIFLVSIRD